MFHVVKLTICFSIKALFIATGLLLHFTWVICQIQFFIMVGVIYFERYFDAKKDTLTLWISVTGATLGKKFEIVVNFILILAGVPGIARV